MMNEPIDSIHMVYEFEKFESFLGLERLNSFTTFIMILVQTFFFLLYLFTLIGFSFFYSVLLIFFCCCCPTGKAKKKKNWAIGQPTGRKTTTPKKATKVIHTNTEKRRDKHTPLSTPSFFVVLKQPTLYPFVILYIFIYLSIPPIHLLNWERVWEWVCIHIIIFLKNLLIHTQTCRFSHNCYFFFCLNNNNNDKGKRKF